MPQSLSSNGRKDFVWQELVDQRLDMTDVNKSWLEEYMKVHGLTEKDLKPGK